VFTWFSPLCLSSPVALQNLSNLCIHFGNASGLNENFSGGVRVPLESIGAFSAILPRWNRSLYLRFDLGKTSSDFFENSGFTSVFCSQKYHGKE